ncbi:hypothetical protein [Denitromonas iodatirespirans]|uniref:Restriction endonuclease subunit S n=1 Tax=Denitromonas iodatirespirans TaxID=2795389 RepID=A0A944HAC8_DENI1|nr:hypothetical protein [Denitromonas iodatirespirans]MBT0964164.1 hypothetical protein [Denitromonas iodatirespirans]
MKGLEANVGSFREIDVVQRFDAEYFRRAYVVCEEAVIRSGRSVRLRDEKAFVQRGQQPAYAEHGLPVINSKHVKGMFVSLTDENRLAVPMGRGPLIKKDDVLINGTGLGTIGRVSLYVSSANALPDNHVTITRSKTFEPEFLAAFLNGKYGQAQIQRRVRGSSGQVELYPFDILEVSIWQATAALRARICDLYATSFEKRNKASRRLAEPDDLLLAELGLVGWAPPQPLTFTASASSALAAERIDAQFFRPLFAEVEARLLATGSACELGSILSTNARGRQPQYADDGLPVINSKHVRTNRVILADNRTATEAGSATVIETGDVLVNGTGEGTIGRAAPYLHGQRALPDNHVTVLRTDRVDPVYLAVFLNSPLGQWQIERHIKGSSGQVELYPSDIARIMIWDAPDAVQQSVKAAILSAFDEERRANDLLEAAKRAVEIAIEDGEPAAMAYLDQAEGAI